MPAMTFNVMVSLDDDVLADRPRLTTQREAILASFAASLDHWIAERQLEARYAS